MKLYTDADVQLVARAIFMDDYPGSDPGPDMAQSQMPGLHEYVQNACAALDALATTGRLLPEATQESAEWGVWWHATDPEGIVITDYQHPRREQAERTAKEGIGEYGITGYSLVKCEHRRYADGSTWTSAWDRVETVMP